MRSRRRRGIIAWFAILFTGRYPAACRSSRSGTCATRRGCAVTQLLLTDKFPPFGAGSPDDGYPIQVDGEYPEHLSRLTTFFRYFLSIPAYVIRGACTSSRS